MVKCNAKFLFEFNREQGYSGANCSTDAINHLCDNLDFWCTDKHFADYGSISKTFAHKYG